MADNQQGNEGKSAVDRATQVAGAVKGAVKAGKAIAGAAKGAASGPVGWALFAVENRKTIAKIIIVLVALFLLPVMLIMMLPAALFGWGSSDTPEDNIQLDDVVIEEALTEDYSVIAKRLEEATVIVDDIFKASHDAVIEKIYADSAGKEMELHDPYTAEMPQNSVKIICEFSAPSDFKEEINTNKLKQKLQEYSDNFFFYMVTEEERIRTEYITNEDGSVTTIQTPYTVLIYTVEYIGNDYITNDVFGLTDEQKELAADYADSLELYLEEGEDDGTTD